MVQQERRSPKRHEEVDCQVLGIHSFQGEARNHPGSRVSYHIFQQRREDTTDWLEAPLHLEQEHLRL